MKNLNGNIRGITLIALIISIIVMVILASVSIGMLKGEDGISTQSFGDSWHYSALNVYCLRLYSIALNDDEVQANHDKAVEYHSLFEK